MEALRHSRYRIVLATAAANQVALWLVYTAALAALVAAGRSVVEVGLLGAFWTLGMPIPVLVGGALTDRFGPRKVLGVGISAQALGILLMAWGVRGPSPEIVPILAAAALVGGAEGFNGVAMQVLAGGVVPRRAMGSAIGSLLIATATGRIVSGLLVGVLVAIVGTFATVLACLAFSGLSLLLVLAVGPVTIVHDEDPDAGSRLDLRPGIRWYRVTPVAVTVLGIAALMALLVYSYFAPLPLVVARTIGTDAAAQGLATALGGIGVLVIGLSLGSLLARLGPGRVLVGAVFFSSACVAALGLSDSAFFTIVIVTVLPMATNAHYATANIVLQWLAPAAMRGRVLGVHTLVFVALEPVGTSAVTAIAALTGERIVLVGMGVTMAVTGALLVLWRPALLRVGHGPPVAAPTTAAG